ncbi:MAG: bifunctional acetate--CoA ligase family protein/GNAT family N-acetyltransferase [Limisphaerales bacterium]
MHSSTTQRRQPINKPEIRWTRRPLDNFFGPKTVAVIGATDKVGSVGRAVIENLRAFEGTVYPINPKREEVLGFKCLPNLAAAQKQIDLAVIVTPATSVPGIMRECVAAKVPSAIVISAGFKEVGPEGKALEQEVLNEAKKGGIRIVGPNCLGIIRPHLKFNASFAATTPAAGNLAFISQSGALCTAILDWSLRENVGFSAFVSVGSMADVSWGDLIYYLGDDPRTRSIVIYMESIGNARAFLSAAREVALTKPIIVIKVGRTEAAAKAAASHTGSMTGSDSVLHAAFRRVGVLRVDSIAELFDMSEVLAKQPRPAGPRLAIVTNAGGPGALATDMLVGSGGQLANITPETRKALDVLLPPHWSHGNPIDILGDAAPDRYAKAVELAANDPNTDGVLTILTPQAMTDVAGTARELSPLAKLGKPLLASWMGGPATDQGEEILNKAGIPTFKYPDRAAKAFCMMWNYSQNLRAIYETPALPHKSDPIGVRRVRADKIIASALKSNMTLLPELESKQILAGYGIPTVETRIATKEDVAVAHAEDLGYPIVVKLFSKTITHKTDVGGVHLNIRSEAGVRRAFNSIKNSVTQKSGAEHFQGVTVQPMIQTNGYELILGSSIDPQFGPVLLFGSGGQLVEVFKDSALGLPPLNRTLARRLIEQTKIFTALKGVRGRAPVDLVALEELLVNFSHLVVEQPRIKEIDINPLVISPETMIALDARMVLYPSTVKNEQLPTPAIRPYPTQYVTKWHVSDKQCLTIRPIRPEDEPLVAKFHETLSEQSVYYRYFSHLKLADRIRHERLTRICFNDYDREIALVAVREHRTKPHEIVGIGRMSRITGVNEAEFALLISDHWQGKGLGSELLQLLARIARDEKLDRILGHILPDNARMLQTCQNCGFNVQLDQAAGEYIAQIVTK